MTYEAERKVTTASGAAGMRDDPRRYRIVPMTPAAGWSIERDGKIHMTGPSIEVLGAWLDAILAGASEYDADDIAKEAGAIREEPTSEPVRKERAPEGNVGGFFHPGPTSAIITSHGEHDLQNP